MTITGAILRNAVIYAAQMITSHRQEIDALNVFPVPDGDTGTNMSMTITNASREVRVKDDSESVSAVASCVASGLLRGARGNSGVILSLIFRGISKGLKGLDEADGAAIASALEHGSSSAYKAVMKPTEGTILTVIRTASEYARKAVNDGENLLWNFLKQLRLSVKLPDDTRLVLVTGTTRIRPGTQPLPRRFSRWTAIMS